MISGVVIFLLLTLGLGYAFVLNTRFYYWRLPLPPGPPIKNWVVGNTFEPKIWHQLHRLTKQYGDIFTMWIGPNPLIVLSSYDAAYQIAELQSKLTSEWPNFVVFRRMVHEMTPVSMRYKGLNDRWAKARRILHTGCSPNAADTYRPFQAKFARQMITEILANPDEFLLAAQKYATLTTLHIAYGKEPPAGQDDPIIEAVIRLMVEAAEHAKPGRWIVDVYRGFRFLPAWMFGNWKKFADSCFAHEEKLHLGHLMGVKERMDQGEAEPCLAVEALTRRDEWKMTDTELAFAVGAVIAAGADTTSIGIANIIMCLALFPEAQKKMQDILDKVCGDRPPTWEDRDELAYIDAFCSEVLRWQPVVPVGVFHVASEDLYYKGYLIPKGAQLLMPQYTIHKDKNLFDEPLEFKPERFLMPQKEGESMRVDPHVHSFAFGNGLRYCPGKEVAIRSLFINAAMLAWAFNIRKKRDPKTGFEIPIDHENRRDGMISPTNPFEVDITPRWPADQLKKGLEPVLGM